MTETDENGPLSLWDAVSLIIGIVIGSTIYKTPGLIFRNVASPWIGLALWVLCGVLSFASALCYAELATTYPRSGGEYNYLTRAYGSWAGFLFGWSQLAIIQTGSIGALSYVFAEYAVDLLKMSHETTVWFALGAVVSLTILNMIGIHAGRHTQKVLVVVKLAGLLLLIIGGLTSQSNPTLAVAQPIKDPSWPLAMILTLYAYGGWNDAAFVTAEVRNRTRNIPRALMLGIGLIVIVYLLVNLAYLRALGFEGLRNSERPAADALAMALGEHAGRAMSLLVMVSALGGLNGLILAVSRVHATMGADHALFERLGRWSVRTHTPVWSLLAQGVVTVVMIVGVGTDNGRHFTDAVFRLFSLPPIPWGDYFNSGFETLFAASAPIFWLFFLSTGVAYFILRIKDRDRLKPFVAPWFPICPIMLCGMSAFGLYSAAIYGAPLLPLIAVPFAIGLPLYGISQILQKKMPNPSDTVS